MAKHTIQEVMEAKLLHAEEAAEHAENINSNVEKNELNKDRRTPGEIAKKAIQDEKLITQLAKVAQDYRTSIFELAKKGDVEAELPELPAILSRANAAMERTQRIAAAATAFAEKAREASAAPVVPTAEAATPPDKGGSKKGFFRRMVDFLTGAERKAMDARVKHAEEAAKHAENINSNVEKNVSNKDKRSPEKITKKAVQDKMIAVYLAEQAQADLDALKNTGNAGRKLLRRAELAVERTQRIAAAATAFAEKAREASAAPPQPPPPPPPVADQNANRPLPDVPGAAAALDKDYFSKKLDHQVKNIQTGEPKKKLSEAYKSLVKEHFPGMGQDKFPDNPIVIANFQNLQSAYGDAFAKNAAGPPPVPSTPPPPPPVADQNANRPLPDVPGAAAAIQTLSTNPFDAFDIPGGNADYAAAASATTVATAGGEPPMIPTSRLPSSNHDSVGAGLDSVDQHNTNVGGDVVVKPTPMPEQDAEQPSDAPKAG